MKVRRGKTIQNIRLSGPGRSRRPSITSRSSRGAATTTRPRRANNDGGNDERHRGGDFLDVRVDKTEQSLDESRQEGDQARHGEPEGQGPGTRAGAHEERQGDGAAEDDEDGGPMEHDLGDRQGSVLREPLRERKWSDPARPRRGRSRSGARRAEAATGPAPEIAALRGLFGQAGQLHGRDEADDGQHQASKGDDEGLDHPAADRPRSRRSRRPGRW